MSCPGQLKNGEALSPLRTENVTEAHHPLIKRATQLPSPHSLTTSFDLLSQWREIAINCKGINNNNDNYNDDDDRDSDNDGKSSP